VSDDPNNNVVALKNTIVSQGPIPPGTRLSKGTEKNVTKNYCRPM